MKLIGNSGNERVIDTLRKVLPNAAESAIFAAWFAGLWNGLPASGVIGHMAGNKDIWGLNEKGYSQI